MKKSIRASKKTYFLAIISALLVISTCMVFSKAIVNGDPYGINQFKENIQASPNECWKKPAENRKNTICNKLTELQQLITEEQFEEAYDKLLHDIKPKLTGLKQNEHGEPWGNGVYKKPWVTCDEFKVSFEEECNLILSQINSVNIPDDDIEPPEIILIPATMTIEDGDVVGGVLVKWQIMDASGIGQASVLLNGVEIASYGPADYAIIDSYLLVCVPGIYTIDVIARDNDNDPEHPGDDWLESSAQSVITIIDDDTSPPSVIIDYIGDYHSGNPGIWNIIIGDPESGLSSVIITIDGVEYFNKQGLNGITPISFDNVPVPDTLGTHVIEVIVANNDNDWISDQEVYVISDNRDIFPDPGTPGPGPIIIG